MQRSDQLRPLSVEHHHALVLALVIKRAVENNSVTTELIERADRMFATDLEPHFQAEERLLYPPLEKLNADALLERIRDDHATLRALAADLAHKGNLAQFGELLKLHARFEEQKLFPYCEAHFAPDTLDQIASALAAE